MDDIGVTETDTVYEDGAGNLYLDSEYDAEVDQCSAVFQPGWSWRSTVRVHSVRAHGQGLRSYGEPRLRRRETVGRYLLCHKG